MEIDKGYGLVKSGKGNKDRLFIIAESLKDKLKEVVGVRKFGEYLFISNKGEKYNIRSLQQIVKKAVKKSGLGKKISCHTLRHSFATHLIEDGYSVSEVQALLGHKNPETTFIYLHTIPKYAIKIRSPLDKIAIK